MQEIKIDARNLTMCLNESKISLVIIVITNKYLVENRVKLVEKASYNTFLNLAEFPVPKDDRFRN